MQAKFDEMFGAKREVVVEEVKIKKVAQESGREEKHKTENEKGSCGEALKEKTVAKATINKPKKTARKTVVTSVSTPTIKKENKRAGKETIKASMKKIKRLGNNSEGKKSSSKKAAKQK